MSATAKKSPTIECHCIAPFFSASSVNGLTSPLRGGAAAGVSRSGRADENFDGGRLTGEEFEACLVEGERGVAEVGDHVLETPVVVRIVGLGGPHDRQELFAEGMPA